MTKFDEIKESISPELSRLNEIITSSLGSNSDLLNEVVANYLKTKGKQIRPIIVILSAKFFSNIVDEATLNGDRGRRYAGDKYRVEARKGAFYR